MKVLALKSLRLRPSRITNTHREAEGVQVLTEVEPEGIVVDIITKVAALEQVMMIIGRRVISKSENISLKFKFIYQRLLKLSNSLY